MSSSFVLESVLGFLGVAIICMVCLLRSESITSPSDSPLVCSFSHTPSLSDDCTDIAIVADSPSYLVGGGPVLDPWTYLGVPKPYETGVIPDSHILHAQFSAKLQNAKASSTEVQSLHHAYLAVLNATALLIRDHQYRQLKQQQQQPPRETATIASEDVRRVVKHLEKDRSAFAEQVARMESWGAFLQDDLQASKGRIKELEGRLWQAEEHARCAPSWFGAWAEFVVQRCTVGEEHRVGSTDLHDAFLEFLRSRYPQGEAPAHKTFRELLEHLGFAYDQIYCQGTNKRGFRGIGLLTPPSQLKLKHESVG